MKTKSIEVTVQADGKVSVEAHGFTGAGCEQATRFIEEALGRQTSRERKPEYYASERTKSSRRQKLGGGGS